MRLQEGQSTTHRAGNSASESAARRFGAQSMIAPLRRALVHVPGPECTAEAWKAYGLPEPFEPDRAAAEHSAFLRILRRAGVELEFLEEHASIACTATYDPALVTDEGAVIMTSGRRERQAETFPMARKLLSLDIPIIGWVGGEGTMDAGDTLWLDQGTLLVGRSYRSNDVGYEQLRRMLDDIVPDIRQFDMPHWLGASFVLHLMSVVSLIDTDLAVVYPRAMPVGLFDLLREREYRLITVPDEEWETQGCNVLALEPSTVVVVEGNPLTTRALQDAGVTVLEHPGEQISVKRISGPTCNSRPLLRDY